MIPRVIVVTGLSVVSATEKGFALNIGNLAHGVLDRFYIVQTTGANAGYTYALYSRKEACPPGNTPTPTIAAGLYNVIPLQTVGAFADPQGTWPADGINHLNQPFSIADDIAAGNASNTQGQLYLRINAVGTLTKLFSVSLTILDPIYP